MLRASGLTIGTFDGVHLGHRKLLECARKESARAGLLNAALTFTRPPRLFFNPSPEPCLLTTPEEKISLLKEFGVQKVWMLEFKKSLADRTFQQFFKDYILDTCRAQVLTVGYDFRFGKGRLGTLEELQELADQAQVRLRVVTALKRASRPVSSGRIREHLKAGHFQQALSLLGHPYRIIGQVKRGMGLGKKLGFPTANLKTPPLKILPCGVYAVKASLDPQSDKGSGKIFYGMVNIGVRPTVSRVSNISLEAHLFNFSGQLYGKVLSVDLVRKLRDERRFADLQSLQRQLHVDRRACLSMIAKKSFPQAF